MADNMANGSGFDPQARYLQLDERVTNLRTSLTNLETETRHGFAQQTSTLTALGVELRASIGALSNDVRSGQRTQWPVILTILGLITTIVLGFGGAVGVLSLSPIRADVSENASDIKNLVTTLNDLPELFVPRKETERLSLRAAEDRLRVEELLRGMMPRSEVELLRQASADDRKHLWDDLGKLRESTVTRAEWMERNHGRDTELADINRRVDEIREELGNTYGVRDVIMDLKAEINSLRAKLVEGAAPQYPR